MSANELESNQAVKKREVELARQRMIDRAIRDVQYYGSALESGAKIDSLVKYENVDAVMSLGDLVNVVHPLGDSYEGIIIDCAYSETYKAVAVKIRDERGYEHWEYPGSLLLIRESEDSADVLNGDAYCPFTNGRCNGQCVFICDYNNSCNLADAVNLLSEALLDEGKRRRLNF